MSLIAAAFYETSWFKAVVYVLIAIVAARVVDFLLARRDARHGQAPGQDARQRPTAPAT